MADFEFTTPVLDKMKAPPPDPTPHVVPTVSEIHTIAEGHLLDHEGSSSCWCAPVQDSVDARIWHHNGCNREHYPSWQTHPKTGAVLTDADGEMLPTKRLTCRCCGELMPQGRHHVDADCLKCVVQPREQPA